MAAKGEGSHRACVVDVAELGTSTALTVRLDGGPELRVRTTDRTVFLPGDACDLRIEPSAISVWPDSSSEKPS